MTAICSTREPTMCVRHVKVFASAALAVGAIAFVTPAEAGGRHGWHGGQHYRHFSFGFYSLPYAQPYSYVTYRPYYWGYRRHHRHTRKVCIRFPCY
jgi:hypothetical protein